MEKPDLIELRKANFVTIDALGPPGRRTFYLQAAQDDLVVTMIIEKEQAAALAVAINNLLAQMGEAESEVEITGLELIEPFVPLFRVGQLKLGYDPGRDMLLLIAEELVMEEGEHPARVHIWATREQMRQLSRKAAAVVAAGRPLCPLCYEPINPDEPHACVRGNGRRRS